MCAFASDPITNIQSSWVPSASPDISTETLINYIKIKGVGVIKYYIGMKNMFKKIKNVMQHLNVYNIYIYTSGGHRLIFLI